MNYYVIKITKLKRRLNIFGNVLEIIKVSNQCMIVKAGKILFSSRNLHIQERKSNEKLLFRRKLSKKRISHYTSQSIS